MNNREKIYKIIMLIFLTTIISSLITTVVLYNYLKQIEGGNEIKVSDKVFDAKIEALQQIIDSKYLSDIDKEKMWDNAIKGYIDGLDDEYTEYMTEDEWKDLEESTLGNYTGIGIYMMESEENKIVVVNPISDSPAEKVGILAGDIITKVNGEEFLGEDLDKAAMKIKGEAGTKVKLEILRNKEILEFEIERKEIDIKNITNKILEKEKEIGYIKIESFDDKVALDFENAYNELKEKGMKKLIIDLRNNTGGIVDEAINIADLFIEKGEVLLVTIDKKEKKTMYKAKRDVIIDIPTVVLVNEYTASASEILAGALKDYQKVKIVGIKTYGKGVIQEVYELNDGSAIKVTTNEYFTPKENKIHETGITPDEEIDLEIDLEEYLQTNTISDDKDNQLQKAIEILK